MVRSHVSVGGRAHLAPLAAPLAAMIVLGCGAPARPEPVATRAPPEPSSTSAPSDPAALAQLDEGERVIAVAGGDCAAACRGLTAVVQARIRLCSPRSSSCDDAERREGDAARKVGAFCAPCEGP